ncbi:MAG: bifunctional UDP-N-acetylglucosamine diphosphorylase/glucosamine-1-phosphate N-acetyltransferase GlmU [Clostridia bacterium]|nr:bifunctional UDP-N-acetylglucosamine diphosphorylase/glucosamine-1-phosphate N-acetyltransferase GlmU [Clostridia bacterium]
MSQVQAVVLAAGKGTRMKSALPKVLHKILGKPMVQYVLDSCCEIGVDKPILVIGHGAQQVKETIGDQAHYVIQAEQLGTGHAVLQAEALLRDFAGDVLVVCGDTPLLQGNTLAALLGRHRKQKASATVLTALMENPTGYGRIVRDQANRVSKIVEHKDATEQEKAIKEVNTGTYCFAAGQLLAALRGLTPNNAQGEYYLTDVLEILNQAGKNVEGFVVGDAEETMGINDRAQLAVAARKIQARTNLRYMLAGVTLTDPATTYIEPGVIVGEDTIVQPNTHLQGKTAIGSGCTIGPNTRIVDSSIAEGVDIQFSVVLESVIGKECTIGPYAYLRPGTVLDSKVKVGDFVEIKKSHIGAGSKVPHLSYVGDATVGTGVNIGAGTITCNYDGLHKYPTVIKDAAFIGSNTNLVAPVQVGEGAVIAAGSTITSDVPEAALGVARGRQRNILRWAKNRQEKQE